MQVIHKHFDTIDSTNTWAKLNAHSFSLDALTLVTADTQTSGRGRFNRRWESPSGQNIYASFCFFLEKSRQDIGNIPQVLALSAVHVLEKYRFKPTLKWPNDILLTGKKVAGILTETTPVSNMLCIVLGIGLNVNMPPTLLEQIDRPATSLFAESGDLFNPLDVLKALQTRFVMDLEHMIKEGFSPFLQDYRHYAHQNKTTTIRFNDNKTVWEGVIHAINNDGSLSMRLTNGEIRTFLTGEILF